MKAGGILLVIVAAVAGAVVMADRPLDSRPRDIQVATAVVRDFDVELTSIGVLDTARSHMLCSEIKNNDGKILFLVDDGTHVARGDLLVTIDSAPFEEKVQALESEVASIAAAVKAKEQILELEKNAVEKNISSAEFNLTVAELDYRRLVDGEGPLQISQYSVDAGKARQDYDKHLAYYNDLMELNDKGFSTQTEITQVKARLVDLKEKWDAAEKKLTSYKDHVFPSMEQAARATVEKAEMDILQVQNAGIFSIAKAMADIEESRSRLLTSENLLKQAKNELSMTSLRAPFDGIAILFEAYREGEKRKPRVGDPVLRNQPLLYLPDIASMMVKTRVREVDLHKISMGQPALVRVDAYPDLTLSGKVDFIGALASEARAEGSGGKFFQLSISLDRPEMVLRPGMTARITIVADRVRQAVTVPVSAVFKERDTWVCYRKADDGFTAVQVSPGRQNIEFVEIVSGLESGDRVSLVKPQGRDLAHPSGDKG